MCTLGTQASLTPTKSTAALAKLSDQSHKTTYRTLIPNKRGGILDLIIYECDHCKDTSLILEEENPYDDFKFVECPYCYSKNMKESEDPKNETKYSQKNI